jgi:hypothetical protein
MFMAQSKLHKVFNDRGVQHWFDVRPDKRNWRGKCRKEMFPHYIKDQVFANTNMESYSIKILKCITMKKIRYYLEWKTLSQEACNR